MKRISYLLAQIRKYPNMRENKDRDLIIRIWGRWEKALLAARVLPYWIDPTKELTLYLVQFSNYKKVGITQQSLFMHLKGYPRYSILDEISGPPKEIFKKHQLILDKLEPYLYHPGWSRAGGFECFKHPAITLEDLTK